LAKGFQEKELDYASPRLRGKLVKRITLQLAKSQSKKTAQLPSIWFMSSGEGLMFIAKALNDRTQHQREINRAELAAFRYFGQGLLNIDNRLAKIEKRKHPQKQLKAIRASLARQERTLKKHGEFLLPLELSSQKQLAQYVKKKFHDSGGTPRGQ
jgi:hypothetical protein